MLLFAATLPLSTQVCELRVFANPKRFFFHYKIKFYFYDLVKLTIILAFILQITPILITANDKTISQRDALHTVVQGRSVIAAVNLPFLITITYLLQTNKCTQHPLNTHKHVHRQSMYSPPSTTNQELIIQASVNNLSRWQKKERKKQRGISTNDLEPCETAGLRSASASLVMICCIIVRWHTRAHAHTGVHRATNQGQPTSCG